MNKFHFKMVIQAHFDGDFEWKNPAGTRIRAQDILPCLSLSVFHHSLPWICISLINHFATNGSQ